MRMKEDHMLNGQLKPGYNVQIGTEAGFVIHYALFPNPTDTKTLPPQLEQFFQWYGVLPSQLIADKGYASVQNYQDLEDKTIEAYIKYPHWDQEKKKRSKKYRYRSWRFQFDEPNNELICPEGQPLTFQHPVRRKSYGGTEETLNLYQCHSCSTCSAKDHCTKQDFRRVQFNPERHRLYQKARERLKTDLGRSLYRKRGSEVETVFGQVKGNHGFRRFRSWGKQNVKCEWAIHMIGYNLKNLKAKQKSLG